MDPGQNRRHREKPDNPSKPHPAAGPNSKGIGKKKKKSRRG
jgi:hypothetical protein